MFGETTTAVYHRISPETAKKLLADERFGITVLDVRSPEEYGELRIPGARLLPDYEFEARIPGEFPDKDAPIMVYCTSGSRAYDAAHWLVSRGYTAVYDFGTIYNWAWDRETGPATGQEQQTSSNKAATQTSRCKSALSVQALPTGCH